MRRLPSCPASGRRLRRDSIRTCLLLEIGARLGQTFHILIDDDVVFLRSLRYHVAHGGEPEAVIRREYPYLSPERVKALALGLSNPDAVPQLCLDDIAAYIRAALPSQDI